MTWLTSIAWFFGGLVLTNGVPHLVSGMCGRAFQTPFASPPGEGLSSATVNVLWGFGNLAIGYALLLRGGGVDPHAWVEVLPPAFGALAMALFHARHFGRFHGGNLRS